MRGVATLPGTVIDVPVSPSPHELPGLGQIGRPHGGRTGPDAPRTGMLC
jgi:hypothetical protein